MSVMNLVAPESSILLSILIYGRNDQYQPDFLYRLTTTLEASAEALEIAGHLPKVEFIVVDWGSNVWLAEAISLSERTAAQTRFICVDPRDAKALSADNPTGFHVTRAVNVGLRRARGRFVLVTAADLLMSVAGWAAVIGLVEQGVGVPVDVMCSLLLLPRRRVPWSFVARQSSHQEWVRWLSLAPQVFPSDLKCAPQINSGMGGFLASRDLWHTLRGLDEPHGAAWGFNDIDLGLRVSCLAPWLDVSGYGAVMFKMEYAPGGRRARLQEGAIPVNLPWLNTKSAVNPQDWGLGGHQFAERSAVDSRSALARRDAAPSWMQADHDADHAEWVRRLTSPVVRSSVAQCLGPAPWFKASTAECLHLIYWYAATRFPKMALELGFRDARYLYALVRGCPSAEIYIVEVATEARYGSTASIVYAAGGALEDAGYRGYLRTVVGEAREGLSVLIRTVPGGLKPEFAIMDVDLLGPAAPEVVVTAVRLMPTWGFLIVHANSTHGLSNLATNLFALTGLELSVLGSGKVGFCVTRRPVAGSLSEPAHPTRRMHVITPFYQIRTRARAATHFVLHYTLRLLRLNRYPLYTRLCIRRARVAFASQVGRARLKIFSG